MFAERSVVGRNAGQLRRIVDSPDVDFHFENSSAETDTGNVDRLMSPFVGPAAVTALATFVGEPNAPREPYARPAVHDVEPIEVTVRHGELAKLEQVNQNEECAETTRAIAARTELAHE